MNGEEAHYIDVISDYIEKNVLDETDKEFNQTDRLWQGYRSCEHPWTRKAVPYDERAQCCDCKRGSEP